MSDESGEYVELEQDKTETHNPDATAKSSLVWSSGLYPLVLHLAYPLPPMNTHNNRALENSEWVFNTAKYLREVQVPLAGFCFVYQQLIMLVGKSCRLPREHVA